MEFDESEVCWDSLRSFAIIWKPLFQITIIATPCDSLRLIATLCDSLRLYGNQALDLEVKQASSFKAFKDAVKNDLFFRFFLFVYLFMSHCN